MLFFFVACYGFTVVGSTSNIPNRTPTPTPTTAHHHLPGPTASSHEEGQKVPVAKRSNERDEVSQRRQAMEFAKFLSEFLIFRGGLVPLVLELVAREHDLGGGRLQPQDVQEGGGKGEREASHGLRGKPDHGACQQLQRQGHRGPAEVDGEELTLLFWVWEWGGYTV